MLPPFPKSLSRLKPHRNSSAGSAAIAASRASMAACVSAPPSISWRLAGGAHAGSAPPWSSRQYFAQSLCFSTVSSRAYISLTFASVNTVASPAFARKATNSVWSGLRNDLSGILLLVFGSASVICPSSSSPGARRATHSRPSDWSSKARLIMKSFCTAGSDFTIQS